MANTKQAKKMQRKILSRTQYNRWWKMRVSKAIKALDSIIAAPNLNMEEVNAHYSKLQKDLDKASKNHVITDNKSDRIKSKLAKKISSLENKTS